MLTDYQLMMVAALLQGSEVGGGGVDETWPVVCAASATVLGALICSLRMAHRYQKKGWGGGSNFCLFACLLSCFCFFFSNIV